MLLNDVTLLEERRGTTLGKRRRAAAVISMPLEHTFELLLDVSNRPSWDPQIHSARVVESLDSSDVVYIRFKSSWPLWPVPIWLAARDMCLQRAWETSEDGSIRIFFSSADHPTCAPRSGVVRAQCKSGSYTIQPSPCVPNKCLVTYALEIDPAGWGSMLPWPFVAVVVSWVFGLLMSLGRLRAACEHSRFAQNGKSDVRGLTDHGALPRSSLRAEAPWSHPSAFRKCTFAKASVAAARGNQRIGLHAVWRRSLLCATVAPCT
jgi:hypothetical protein